MIRIAMGVTGLRNLDQDSGQDGIGQYTQHLIKRVMGSGKVEWVPVRFGRSSFCDSTPSLQFMHNVPRSLLSCVTGFAFEQVEIKKLGINLFHAPDHRVPKLARTPVLATIHDLIPFEFPYFVSKRHRLIVNPLLKRSYLWADQIITVSNYSKERIVDYLGIDPNRIKVIYQGVDFTWRHNLTLKKRSELRLRYDLPRDYFVSVGTIQPRKNFPRLIEAYKRLPVAIRAAHDLIIIGRYGWGEKEFFEHISKPLDIGHVRWLKGVSNLDLVGLVKTSLGMVFPSLAEGFGIPAMEALAAGIPLAASNSTSLPEVCGSAANYFEPNDVESIADAMKALVEDSDRREELSALGLLRSKEFSWAKTAAETYSVYESML